MSQQVVSRLMVSNCSLWAAAVAALIIGFVVSINLFGGVALGTLVLFVLAFPLLLRNPRYLLYTFVFTLPFGETDILRTDTPIAVTLSNIQLLFLTVLLMERFFRRALNNAGKFRVAKSYKIYIVTLSLILVADLISIASHPAGTRFLITRISFILTFLIGVVFIDSPRTMCVALRCLAIGLMIASVLTFLHSLGVTGFGHVEVLPAARIGEWRSPFPRTIGIPGIDFGLYGMFMLSTLPLVIISLLKKEPLFHNRPFSLVWVALVILGVFISQSRSTWVGLIMSVLVLVLLLRERGTTRNSNGYLTVLLAIGLVLLIAVGLFLGWENFLQLGSTLLDFMIKKRATSIMRRLTQIEFAWRVLTSTPQSLLFGQGYGRFEDLFARAYPDAASFFLHNHYMGYFFGSGLLGLLSYGLLLLIALRDFYIVARKGQEPKCYWGAGLLAGFVGMLVVLAFFAKISNVKLLWLMIALAQKTRHFSTLQTGVKTHKGDRHHWGELEVS